MRNPSARNLINASIALCLGFTVGAPRLIASSASDIASGDAFGGMASGSNDAIGDFDEAPIGRSSGQAPPAYSESVDATEMAILQDTSFTPLGSLLATTLDILGIDGTVTTLAASNVGDPGAPATHTTTSQSKIETLELRVGDLPLVPPLLEIEADEILTTSSVSETGGTFTPGGGFAVTNLAIRVNGIPADLTTLGIALPPLPNTTVDLGVLGLAGVTLSLNEQSVTGDASSGMTVERTALRLNTDASGLTLPLLETGLTSNIVLGHSSATQGSDTDGDLIPDFADGDSDGDGIRDAIEIANALLSSTPGDTDGDGILDRFDLDSDNDGINDVIEAGGIDANGDGRQDPSGDANPDEDGDGIVDTADPDDAIPTGNGTALPISDSDGDLRPDYIDLDSDNDSISDLVEAGHSAADTNGDGLADGADLDEDGIPANVDLRAGFGDAPDATPQPDSDSDGLSDAIEIDSDNDGTRDIVGTGNESLDTDNDGRVDVAIDSDLDRDGVPSPLDTKALAFGGIVSPFADPDGDSIPNALEGNGRIDTDSDGIPDMHDADSDADGIPDLAETSADADNDTVPNHRDLDSDGDGIADVIEGGGTDVDGNGIQDGFLDADDDGLVAMVDPDESGTPLPLPNSDGDSVRDFLDLDSDNDSLPDVLESGSGGLDLDGDGRVDGNDTDLDGIADAADGLPLLFGDLANPAPKNDDDDHLPNHIDPNSDNRGLPDIAGTPFRALDTDGDGRIDFVGSDYDGDGIPDAIDTNVNMYGGAPKFHSYGEWIGLRFPAPDLPDLEIVGGDADPDGDGWNNATEFYCGTAPLDSSDFPTLIPTFTDDSCSAFDGLMVARDPLAYAFGFYELSTELENWSSHETDIEITSSEPEFLVAQLATPTETMDRLFLRLRVDLP